MSTVAITNARLMDPATGLDTPGSLLVEDAQIAALGPAITAPQDAEQIDAKGQILAPGLIDMRAHMVDWQAAVSGGFTTLALQPDQTTVIDTDAAVERIRARARALGKINVYPMGAATKGLAGAEMAEIGLMQASGAVAFTDGRRQIASPKILRRLLEYAGHFGALVVDFPEDRTLAEGGMAHEGEVATRLGLPGIPATAEVIAIERDCRLVELTGVPLHFALVSSAAGVAAIRTAKARGLPISAATAPHYLHLNHQALENYRTFAKLSPPLRTEEDRLALIGGLADGTLDVLASDHDPQSSDRKRQPFEQAAHGVVSFESALALGLSLVHAGTLDLMTLLGTLTARPAALLGLEAGRLAAGAPADLVLIDKDRPWRLDRTRLRTAADNIAFDTLPVQGRVTTTWVAGRCVYADGEVL